MFYQYAYNDPSPTSAMPLKGKTILQNALADGAAGFNIAASRARTVRIRMDAADAWTRSFSAAADSVAGLAQEPVAHALTSSRTDTVAVDFPRIASSHELAERRRGHRWGVSRWRAISV